LDIQILLICALIGVFVRAALGLNILALLGAASTIALILPIFLISLSGNPETSHDIANTLDVYIVTLTTALPSVVAGEALGIFARDIVGLPKTIFDHIRTLL